jgi:ERCC4-type nuclease
MTDKEKFIKNACIICDTREQQNVHIVSRLNELGVKFEHKKLDFGDYSFKVGDRDFSLQCVVERKANINELWGNLTKERERIEKEFQAMSCITHSANLVIEHCPDRDFLKSFQVDDFTMKMQGRKVQDIGKYIYSTLQSWSSSNRYGLNIHYMRGNQGTAELLLSIFYYYWHNFCELIKPIKRS